MTPTAPVQTLASGNPKSQKYANLGYSGQALVVPPEQLFGMFVGKPESGKSSILLTHPECYLLNLDLMPTTVPPAAIQATVWPGRSSSGQAIDADGSILGELTFDQIRKKIDLLIQMSKQNKPRPQTIAFDSMTALIRITKDYITKIQGLERWDGGKNGANWERVYDIICGFPWELRAAGYGVYFTCHLTEAVLNLEGGSGQIIRPEFQMGDALVARLHNALQLVAPVICEYTTESTETDKFVEINGKKVKTGVSVETKKVRKHYLDFSNASLNGITKGKGITGRIDLPLEAGWDAFAQAYRTATNQ